ncbi:NADH-quinone oxidoreductase subunit C [uncultured Gemmiger sp.]|uniref:NADH-quinone oxidoreductase subunit C n=1 Tax=uncultured Gemmiger sp. TaxID=1623490 RepID=UPI0025E3897A|nr:NADH-quinone oxidoreductase subunit C [uncultured Gemmiger sp.]
MEAQNTIEPITMAEFIPQVLRFKQEGWHVVQICAGRIPEGYELSYSFGRDYDMRTLRLAVAEDETVPSITQAYPGAFLQENEAAELFGVHIVGITQDYRGKLYRIAKETPFKQKG